MADIKHSSIILKDGNLLVIRKVNKEDAAGIIEYMHLISIESDNLTFGKDGFQITVEQEEEFIESTSNDTNSIMLVGYVKDELVSIASISTPTRERIAHTSEIGLSVKKKYWNVGVGSALLTKLIEFAKQTNTIKIIHLKVRADNKSGIYIYNKLGFEEIGCYRKFFKIDESYYDALLMNLYI